MQLVGLVLIFIPDSSLEYLLKIFRLGEVERGRERLEEAGRGWEKLELLVRVWERFEENGIHSSHIVQLTSI